VDGSGVAFRNVPSYVLKRDVPVVLRHDSIVGTTFLGRVVEQTEAGVITEVTGSAYRTGTATFSLDPRDTLGTGFSLR